jgi:molybdopterin/thiamine biosynthesis adenylyltransferase
VSHQLVNLNPFLQEYEREGYLIDLVNGYLVFYGLPYLTADLSLAHGNLVFKLDMVTPQQMGVPGSDHQAYWQGGQPYNSDGSRSQLGGGDLGPQGLTIGPLLKAVRSFSMKPMTQGAFRDYESYKEKAENYFAMIVGPAKSKFPNASPIVNLETKSASFFSPLKLVDTFSAKAGIVDLSAKLARLKVGIIGLGGTGIYVLDYISKTHLAEIHLYDDDVVKIGNAFRFPGVLPSSKFGLKKVQVAAEIYSDIHGEVHPHAEKVTIENVNDLNDLDYVFVCVDHAPSRKLIAESLVKLNVAFVDVGMGLNREAGRLSGLVRASEVETETFENLKSRAFLPFEDPPDNEYRHHAQIGELNALNAAMAVIMFKKTFGFYFCDNHHSVALFDLADMGMIGVVV